MTNVLLIGIHGVYNYGCEAIVRGTVNILKGVNPDIRVTYASYRYEDDKRRLADCDVEVIERDHFKGRWSWHNIVRKAMSLLGVRYEMPYDTTDWLASYDTVFCIGGDLYTVWSNNDFNRPLPRFLEKCQRKGLRYVLWGASVGKFETNPEALRFFSRHLRKVDLIVAREPETMAYLQTLGLSANSVLAPDPAFSVLPMRQPRTYGHVRTLGLNLSPLSVRYKYATAEDALQAQTAAVERLVSALDVDVLLIPHVLDTIDVDNDLTYMQQIYANLSASCRQRVSVVDCDPGFVGLKKSISACDFVIAARMHCAINAVTCGCPTLLLSYSEKAKGMAEFIYGNREAVIDLSEFEDTGKLVGIIRNWHATIHYDAIASYDYKRMFSERGFLVGCCESR
ncbi:MAG: polysaccharide pyruvyl transferase family protein [Paraprevotella sp.]|nr:polysaccharide pyruvyl transferase family protein [Paraprevotella sp.]